MESSMLQHFGLAGYFLHCIALTHLRAWRTSTLACTIPLHQRKLHVQWWLQPQDEDLLLIPPFALGQQLKVEVPDDAGEDQPHLKVRKTGDYSQWNGCRDHGKPTGFGAAEEQ